MALNKVDFFFLLINVSSLPMNWSRTIRPCAHDNGGKVRQRAEEMMLVVKGECVFTSLRINVAMAFFFLYDANRLLTYTPRCRCRATFASHSSSKMMLPPISGFARGQLPLILPPVALTLTRFDTGKSKGIALGFQMPQVLCSGSMR